MTGEERLHYSDCSGNVSVYKMAEKLGKANQNHLAALEIVNSSL